MKAPRQSAGYLDTMNDDDFATEQVTPVVAYESLEQLTAQWLAAQEATPHTPTCERPTRRIRPLQRPTP